MPALLKEKIEDSASSGNLSGGKSGGGKNMKARVLRLAFESVIALVAVVITLEVLFAMAGVGEQEYLRVDKVLGFCPMENRHVTWRKEGFGRIQFNSEGMNDIEHPLAKPPGTFRIAIVGDSFVESLQVDRKQNFLSLLERQLNEKYGSPGRKIEVLNFGCSANSMGQFYKKMETKIFRYDPDVVLVGMSVDATKLLAPLQGGFAFANARPTYLLNKDGKLVEDWQVFNWWNHTPDGKRFAKTAFLRQYSRIWGAIGTMMGGYSAWCADLQAGKVWGWGAPPAGAAAAPADIASAANNKVKAPAPIANDASSKWVESNSHKNSKVSEVSKDSKKTKVFTGPVSAPFMEQSSDKAANLAMPIPQAQGDVDAATKQYWPVADKLIRGMQDMCTAHHCRLGIVHLPARPEVGFDNPRETQLLTDLAQQLKIPFVDLTPAFLAAPKSVALIYTVHMTPAGHKLTFEKVEDFIEKNHLY